MTVRHISSRIQPVLESTKWFIISAFFFRVVLEISYRGFVTVNFEYAGFILSIDYLKYLESWLIWICLVIASPKVLLKASDYLMAYLLFSFFTPLLVYYGLSNEDREHLYILLLGFLVIYFFRIGRPLKIPIINHGRVVVYSISAWSSLAVTGWLIMIGGLSYFNLDLSRVYEFRSDVGELISQWPMGYLNMWATKVFGPILLIGALWKKKYWIAAIIYILHIVWFGISSHKAILFYPLLVIFVWWFFRSSKALAIISVGMACAVLFSFLIYMIFDYKFLACLVVRREFFVQSFLAFKYYEFFSSHEHIYWSSSFASPFIDYPYESEPAKLIGAYLGTGGHANNSFLATGFMHAGILGVMFYGFLVGLLFRLIDSLSNKGIPLWVAVASVIVPFQSLFKSADLTTALLSHGIGVSIVILFLFRSQEKHVHSG